MCVFVTYFLFTAMDLSPKANASLLDFTLRPCELGLLFLQDWNLIRLVNSVK